MLSQSATVFTPAALLQASLTWLMAGLAQSVPWTYKTSMLSTYLQFTPDCSSDCLSRSMSLNVDSACAWPGLCPGLQTGRSKEWEGEGLLAAVCVCVSTQHGRSEALCCCRHCLPGREQRDSLTLRFLQYIFRTGCA